MTQNSGISNESSYSVTADNGSTFSYTVKYGVMYRWSQLTGAGNSTVKPFGQQPVSSVTIEVTKGTVVLNEIAFFDEEGNVIPVHAEDDNSALLVDEQDSASEYRTAKATHCQALAAKRPGRAFPPIFADFLPFEPKADAHI